MTNKLTSFQVLSNLIANILSKYIEQDLNKVNCTLIYQDIFGAIVDTVEEAGIKAALGNEALNLAAQMFYDMVTVNGNQELDPNIFSQRAKLENIPTKELVVLCSFFEGSEAAQDIAHFIAKRRS